MGERLLCKQEVVGSIPSGSTSRDCSSEMLWFSAPHGFGLNGRSPVVDISPGVLIERQSKWQAAMQLVRKAGYLTS